LHFAIGAGDLNPGNEAIEFVEATVRPQKQKPGNRLRLPGFCYQILVAGIGFEPMTFRL
jgi:hypothetical protein